ncbi:MULTISPECIES: APC family permease [unclassified Nocardioides]|jgi:amino acid transporter|uniref:APC family permease n=1 Tax=unclassified Nocardioides TaxID=2615069 RepID=UPI000703AE68|nr:MULTISPECIES: APC family permease [unclassified Nocardioides]KRC59710.1 amino acid permease [Nocardioides sp. Root79]KRC68465.1 amino acid permease [Nocardioides sp. Root240]
MSDTVNTTLRKNALGVGAIVFLVLAAVAPLTGMVVVASLAIAFGNGGGAPFSFLAVAAILLLFAIGYGKMSSQMVNAGGFYAFVVKGLGRPAGLAAGYIATLGYNFFVVGTIGTSGFFMMVLIDFLFGFSMNWFIWGGLSMVVAYLMAVRGIDFSSKVLGVSLVLESSILVIFDVAVLFKHGYDFSAFSGDAITSGSLSIGLLLAATGFLGFEATSLFSEEAKNPLKTIPRATYLAITIIGLLLAVTTWAVVSATGVEQAQQSSIDHLEAGDLVFSLGAEYLGEFMMKTMMVLLLVSLFAAMLAFHNSATRYLFSLGRARVLPQALSRTSSSGAPVLAGTLQAGFALLVAAVFRIIDLDPILQVVPAMLGFGTLAIVVLQALAALSIVVHFRRSGDSRIGSTLVAPAIGFVGLSFIVVMAVTHFDVVAGSTEKLITSLPWLLVLALLVGVAQAFYLKTSRPEIYDGLNADLERFDAEADDAATTAN